MDRGNLQRRPRRRRRRRRRPRAVRSPEPADQGRHRHYRGPYRWCVVFVAQKTDRPVVSGMIIVEINTCNIIIIVIIL